MQWQACEGIDRKNELLLSLVKALHAQYSAALAECDSDSDDSDGDPVSTTKQQQKQPAVGEAGAAASRRVNELHQRCVDIVMGLVSQDEGNWDFLFM